MGNHRLRRLAQTLVCEVAGFPQGCMECVQRLANAVRPHMPLCGRPPERNARVAATLFCVSRALERWRRRKIPRRPNLRRGYPCRKNAGVPKQIFKPGAGDTSATVTARAASPEDARMRHGSIRALSPEQGLAVFSSDESLPLSPETAMNHRPAIGV